MILEKGILQVLTAADHIITLFLFCFLSHVPFSVSVAGWATRRRVSEATSTCWRKESIMTGGCGEAVMLNCALLGSFEQ